MPTGNLPSEGKKLWEEVYQKAKKGSCKGDDECAARTAWSAVKGAGWSKDKDGQWHKTKSLTEFSLRIDRASYDKATNERRFRAVASDTDEDSRKDSMSLELFNDFLTRINTQEPVPEEYQSDFWVGGTPYLSVSHYPDLSGKGVPGVIDAVYIDGNYLKSKGKFNDTPLGRKCFEAICADLYGDTKVTESESDNKVRISIAFLDWKHQHKSNGYVFDRKEADTICPECLLEMMRGESKGKIFLKGHLIHEALTRVPVNIRTSMEVDKSMADKVLTRKDDAASIVGEELANELEEQAEVVGKSEALVIRSDEEVVEEAKTKDSKKKEDKEEPCDPEVDEGCGKKKEEKKSEIVEESKPQEGGYLSDEAISKLISTIKESMTEFINVSPTPVIEHSPSHPLDTFFSEFKSRFDEIINSDVAEDMKLQMVQEPFNTLGTGIVSVVNSSVKPKEVTPETKSQIDIVAALSQVMQPFGQKLDLLLTQLATPAVERTMPQIPQRRSIPPSIVQQIPQQQVSKSETPHLRAIIDKTV